MTPAPSQSRSTNKAEQAGSDLVGDNPSTQHRFPGNLSLAENHPAYHERITERIVTEA